MTQVFALATLVVLGVIAADVLTHPKGVNAAGQQINSLQKTAFTSLLGNVPK